MGAYYLNTISKFLEEENKLIIGSLTLEAGLEGFYQQKHSQTFSYEEEINILKSSFKQLIYQNPKAEEFGILLEYPIARRDKRIDAIVIANDLVIIIEFKVGKGEYSSVDKEQLLDYCLDIRDFHFESRGKFIAPILLATTGINIDDKFVQTDDFVQEVIFSNSSNLHIKLNELINTIGDQNNSTINLHQWDDSDYIPTPTIIEAARNLYDGKSVVEISRSHARKKNLARTSEAVIKAIKEARINNEKIICFITGVPGAGKTLAGLNIAHDKAFQNEEGSLSTFLSGNGPLIEVLRTALSRDAYKKLKKGKISKEDRNAVKEKQSRRIIAFIENVHAYFKLYFTEKDHLPNSKLPNNKIVIFDEAQRAWNSEQSKKKFKRDFSEPEMMFEIMSRHKDWAVIVALVGGGQEINTGEAGLPEWGRVIEEKYSDWKVYISPQLNIGDHSTGNLTLFNSVPKNVEIIENSDLHLEVSLRSYKAEKLSTWVSLVLSNQAIEAQQIFNNDLTNYKIVVTRDLEKAKKWLRSKCKGTRRMGLVASSGARRLRPYGLEVKIDFEAGEWFLNNHDDIRSSYYLEIPATEFGIQGLELDWVGVCWDLDLFRSNDSWDFKSFSGSKWQTLKNAEKRKYAINKYRVLLTRAREGMVLFVPPGSKDDPTRSPELYNAIAKYLVACGVVEL